MRVNSAVSPTGERRLEVITEREFIGGLTHLGTARDGSFFIVVTEVWLDNAIQVEQSVRHYRADGALLGVAHVPLERRLMVTDEILVLGPDDQVYMMLLLREGAEILRLRFEN